MNEFFLVCTDIIDSTQTLERFGDERAVVLWTEHDRAARTLLARHHGREIDRTDGFFLIFASGIDATSFALGYHDEVTALGLAARVAVHFGSVTWRANAAD